MHIIILQKEAHRNSSTETNSRVWTWSIVYHYNIYLNNPNWYVQRQDITQTNAGKTLTYLIEHSTQMFSCRLGFELSVFKTKTTVMCSELEGEIGVERLKRVFE